MSAFLILHAFRKMREEEEKEEKKRKEKREEEEKHLYDIYKEGRKAFLSGKSKNDVPYCVPQEHNNWIRGFNEARKDVERNKKTFADWIKNPFDRIK
jgi:ribosome modulation factor